MKHNKLFYGAGLLSLLATQMFSSCADDKFNEYTIANPDKNAADYEYLNSYGNLKDYVDRSANPNFKVATGITASEFNNQGLVYTVAKSNFDEMTAGNAMKYASCVADDGSMNFSTVRDFVNNAEAAGMTVYGHTLAWHSQQNIKYLSKLIADKEIPVDPNASNSFLKYICGEAGANSWDKQALYTLSSPLTQGAKYVLKVDIKAAEVGKCALWPIWNASDNKNQWGGSNDVQYLSEVDVTTDWSTKTWEFEASFPHDCLQFVFGKMADFIAFDNISLIQEGSDENLLGCSDFEDQSKSGWSNNWNGPSFEIAMEGSAPAKFFVDQLDNGEMSKDGSMDNFVVRESGKGDVPGTPLEGQGPDGMNCIAINSVANPTNSWDTQFFIYTPNKKWEAGEAYHISFWYKATEEASSETQCHGAPGSYMHWQMLPSNPTFTTEWQKYDVNGTIPDSGAGMSSIAFNLNVNKNAVTYYFADIHWEIEQSGNAIPLTKEEKKDTLTWAMNQWIEGIMDATDGLVKAWDVVNEPIGGGGDDGEGNYALQHADNTDDNGVSGDNFYWQDLLGDIDYVRTAVAAARKYYKGEAADLKLFINDYNLESDWDDNKKLKSLINWIAKWEADGVTKIDGIGTQMHISCYANEQTQASKKAHITKMFELMAQTDKLIKISELDMGYVDENGQSVQTENMTEEQHLAMKDLYRFVVSEYMRIIPAQQQYGITQWCTTDSPAESSWRAGQPTGLWDKDYYRKHTYAGFADGLAGKE